MATWTECLTLNRAATQLGIETPTILGDLIRAGDDIDQAFNALTMANPDKAIRDACAKGKLDSKTVVTAFTNAVDYQAKMTAADAVIPGMVLTLASEFTNAVRGNAGAALIQAIRPRFDEAARSIADTDFTPDTANNPAAILAMGDRAAQQWRDLPRHRTTLDHINRELVWNLSNYFVNPLDYHWDRPALPISSWVIGIDGNTNLAEAASIQVQPASVGGVWHTLHLKGFRLHLNTPDEAHAVQQAYIDSLSATEERRERAEAETIERIRTNFATATR